MSGKLVKRSLADYPCYRISPGDTNYFALAVDPSVDGVPWVTVIEIFESGGATPPNSHAHAHEMFYVLQGEGLALSDGTEIAIKAGDVMVLPPGSEHVVKNTGSGKLYTLTTMVPDEAFAALIRSGTPVALDAEDLAVLSGRSA